MLAVFGGLWLILLVFLAPSQSLPAELHLDYIAAVAPPHHEYISGRFDKSKAERFYFEVKPSVEYKRLKYHVAFIGHGVQDWHPSDYWGDNYWSNSEAWKIQEMRYDISHGGTFDLIGDKLQINSEFVMPINRRDYHGVYYWRLGFSGRLF
jgi:hypothetical protein